MQKLPRMREFLFFWYTKGMATFIAIIVGSMLGSFLSVLLERWPHWQGVVGGRSGCPRCHHRLAWYDLIPLVSWAMLGGRCRYCHARIALLYPMLELTMAGVLALSVMRHGFDLFECAMLFGLVALFFFDLRYRVLPDAIIAPMVLVAAVWLFAGHQVFLFWGPISAIALFLFFGGLYMISRGRWLGFGDVKLAFLMGLLFGRGVVGVTLGAIWIGAVVGIALMVAGRANRHTALPFGSFWTAMAVIALLWPGPFYTLSRLFLSYGQ